MDKYSWKELQGLLRPRDNLGNFWAAYDAGLLRRMADGTRLPTAEGGKVLGIGLQVSRQLSVPEVGALRLGRLGICGSLSSKLLNLGLMETSTTFSGPLGAPSWCTEITPWGRFVLAVYDQSRAYKQYAKDLTQRIREHQGEKKMQIEHQEQPKSVIPAPLIPDTPHCFFYLRNKDGHPVGVVAIERSEPKKLKVAISVCNPKDSWNRHKGIARAFGRLRSVQEHCRVFPSPVKGADWLCNGCPLQGIRGVLLHLDHPWHLRDDIDFERANKTFWHQCERMLENKEETK